MIDAHCHLNFKAFEEDVDSVIKDAEKRGVNFIVNVGTSLESSKKAVELAALYKNLYAAVGVHPHHADKTENSWITELEILAKNSKVLAIGECGMDFYSYKTNGVTNKKTQREIFAKQIELSCRLGLPLQIHNRLASSATLDVVCAYRNDLKSRPGMFHCFSGDIDFLKKVLDLGFYVGFDGNITYKGKARGETVELSELVKFAPLERILTETDSPFLAPDPYRGNRNVPANVVLVVEFIARLKNVDYNKAEEIVSNNFLDLFNPRVSK